MEELFSKLDRVLDVISRHIGGNVINPTYEVIIKEKSYHDETIEINFDFN